MSTLSLPLSTPAPARKREHTTQRSHAAWLQVDDFCTRAELEDGPAGKALGYGTTVVGKWRADRAAPVVAGLAAEALVRRLGTAGTPYKAPSVSRTFCFRIDNDEAEAVLLLLAKLGVKATEI